MTLAKIHYEIRPYESSDERAVVELLNLSLGGGPAGQITPEFFRWKHLENPFGRSLILIAENEQGIIGFRAFMRWRFSSTTATVRAARAVDTATHPQYQRMGLFSSLTRVAVEELRADTDLIFNTPNSKSLPGYLKLGWNKVGRTPLAARPRSPVRFLFSMLNRQSKEGAASASYESAPTQVANPLQNADEVQALLAGAETRTGCLSTVKDAEYLRWRYERAPGLHYRVKELRDSGELVGLAVYRLRMRKGLREGAIVELISLSKSPGVARSLLREVVRQEQVDYVVAGLPNSSPARKAALGLGFIPVPFGPTMVVNQLGSDIGLDPSNSRAWSICLGDIELF